ncbi:MAG: CsbD family protein [Archangium sp.]|nr:CsbD family protein [Archangium sp.]
MNWERVRGEARQVAGLLKQKWAKLTDDDLLLLEGQKEAFLGRLQERTGLEKEEVERQFDELLSGLELDRKHLGVIHLTAG